MSETRLSENRPYKIPYNKQELNPMARYVGIAGVHQGRVFKTLGDQKHHPKIG